MTSTASDWFITPNSYGKHDSIYISKDEHDRLVQISHYYASLRENLVRGGVTDNTVDLLSNVVTEDQRRNRPNSAESPASHGNLAREPHIPRNHSRHKFRNQLRFSAEWSESDDSCENETSESETAVLADGLDNDDTKNDQQFVRECDRTVCMFKLAPETTHADIAAVIRGGMLVDIFIRYKEHAASVSFLHEEDARAFLQHANRHDIYINQKRVEVSWNDRQFKLPNHLRHKLKFGATRNLVIRRCRPEHTEEDIRDDVEHIHNLVVIKIEFIGDKCFICTNSIGGAAFARTCMMSRRKYKGSHIEFYPDECAQALVRPVQRTTPPAPLDQTSASAMNAMANRFHLLDVDYE